jgi:hypothetical protein
MLQIKKIASISQSSWISSVLFTKFCLGLTQVCYFTIENEWGLTFFSLGPPNPNTISWTLISNTDDTYGFPPGMFPMAPGLIWAAWGSANNGLGDL